MVNNIFKNNHDAIFDIQLDDKMKIETLILKILIFQSTQTLTTHYPKYLQLIYNIYRKVLAPIGKLKNNYYISQYKHKINWNPLCFYQREKHSIITKSNGKQSDPSIQSLLKT